MPTVLLPILPGTLSPGVCYDTEQQRLNAFAEALSAQLNGMSFWNVGDTVPSEANRSYPWFRTSDGLLYFYSGAWLSRVPPSYNVNIRHFWRGSLVDLQTYDGGDTGTPSDRSGPMWVEDEEMRGRFAVGVGSIGSTVIALNDSLGAGEVTIGYDNLPEIQRLDPTNTQPPTDDNFFPNDYAVDVDIDAPWIRKANIGEADPDPLTIIPPYMGGYWIKWSGRIYRKI